MRTFGSKFFFDKTAVICGLALAAIVAGTAMQAQTAQAPYLLPYTLSTYVGANGQYASGSFGTACPMNTGGFIQNASGDGCIATLVSINGEPHDVRVDARGNLFFIDNSSTTSGVIHKINPFNFLSTIYIGNATSCYTSGTYTSTQSKYGDSCQANDGLANNSGVKATPVLKAIRGLSASVTGDLGIAGYNDNLDHNVLANTGVMRLIAGTGTAGSANGAVGSSMVSSSRGIGFDQTGNTAYVADTGNNVLRQIVNVNSGPTASIVASYVTALNTANTKNVSSGVAASGALLSAPEDVQTDSYGNIYIADYGNNVIRAIYKGGTLPWFPVGATQGFIYTIAGSVNTTTSPSTGVAPVTGYVACSTPPAATTFDTAPTYMYPYDGSTPPVSPLSVAMSVRKFSFDAQNNMYLADSAWNVVWFIDHVTGQMRLLAGRYYSAATAGACNPTTGGASAGVPALGCSASASTIGDGCPGPDGQFINNADLAVSADRIGNAFITDPEGNTGAAATARIRKLLNGTVFPATAAGTPVTQSLLVHFGPGDTPAASNAFTINNSDYAVVGTPTCTVNATGISSSGNFPIGDNTDDCVVKVSFTPSHAGADVATLTATSTLGGVASFVLSGSGTAATLAYDPGNIAQFTSTATAAQGVALDGAGNAYVADTTNNQVLFVSASGASSVLVPASSGIKSPSAVALGVDGSVYIADTGNNLIRKYSTTGTLTTYGGGGTAGCTTSVDSFNDNCLATQATFKAPAGLATDTLGNLYVADTGNNVVRVIASNGFVSAFAGGATTLCATNTDSYGDGCGAAATKFNAPTGMAFDPIGNYLYVADTGESRVRKIFLSTTYASSGTGGTVKATSILVNPVSAVAGTGVAGSTVSSSGVATFSALSAPTGVAVDASGTVYIADTGNAAIRLVTPGANGVITTIAGILGSSGGGSAGSSATITASSYTTHCSNNLTTVTLTAVNNFSPGLSVTFAGLTNATFLNGQNLPVLATGLTAASFQVAVPGQFSCPPGTVGTDSAPVSSTDTGTASYSTSATSIGLASPSAVAVTAAGSLVIADAGNSRLLLDSRSQVSYNFGPVAATKPPTSSSPQPFTVTNIGSSSTNVGAFTPSSTVFTLTPAATSTGVPACPSSSSSYAPGTICNVNAVYTPTTVGLQSATFTDLAGTATGSPSLTLSGTGAGALTSTTATVVQTSPATGDPQFAGTFTVQATITASSCNQFAPSCSPSGTVQFTVDNAASGAPVSVSPVTSPANSSAVSMNLNGLTVGQHSISCTFKADSTDNAYYGGSTCMTIMVTVDQGGTTSVLSIAAGTNSQQQYPTSNCTTNTTNKQTTCTDTTLTATVSANTAGTPTGSVTFYETPPGSSTPVALGSAVKLSAIGGNGVASLSLNYTVDANGNLVSDGTLLPGTYTLTCTYSGDANYAGSTCAGKTFTVLPQPAYLQLSARPCVPSSLYAAGTQTPQYSGSCGSLATQVNGLPTVAVGQGSTTDVTLFVIPSNTVSGTLSFSCSGLPANSVCTFSPQTLTVAASTGYTTPIYTDVTLWTDIPPGVIPTKSELKLPGHGGDGTMLALMLGWPLTLLGFIGLLRFRKAGRMRGLTLTALGLLMVGSALTLSGCAGPGIYHPNLTPTGTSAVTITVTGPNVSQSTVVEFTVTPGIAGQQ